MALRWPDGKVKCPECGSDKITYLANARLWKCYAGHPRPKFSLKTGTIMEDSPLGLDKWLSGLWLIVNCKNGISSCEVARDLRITQKSAWFLDHRIRMALHEGNIEKASGHVEADETFIGGKARNMHIAERKRRITGTGGTDKTAVMGIMERGGKVRTVVVPNRKKHALQAEVRKHVEAGAALYTVRYLDEQSFRYNYRKDMRDFDRFRLAASQMVGKRLTWDEATGRNHVPQTCRPR